MPFTGLTAKQGNEFVFAFFLFAALPISQFVTAAETIGRIVKHIYRGSPRRNVLKFRFDCKGVVVRCIRLSAESPYLGVCQGQSNRPRR